MVVDAGFTIIELPLPIGEPAPHPPEYQYQSAPVPNEPPETVNVLGDPEHTVGLLALITDASFEFVFTVIVMAATLDVSQPSALT